MNVDLPRPAIEPGLQTVVGLGQTKLSMTLPKLNEIDYLKAWGIFFLLATAGGLVAGMIVGGVIGFILGAIGVPLKIISLITGFLGFVVAIPISYLCFRFCVAKFVLPRIIIEAS